jgi:hypothetical protein
MSEQLTAWIRRIAALNDSDLEEELKWVNKNSLNAFARATGRNRRWWKVLVCEDRSGKLGHEHLFYFSRNKKIKKTFYSFSFLIFYNVII